MAQSSGCRALLGGNRALLGENNALLSFLAPPLLSRKFSQPMFLSNILSSSFPKKLFKVKPLFQSRDFPLFLWAHISSPHMARILELLQTYIKNQGNFPCFWKFNIKKINSAPTPHSTHRACRRQSQASASTCLEASACAFLRFSKIPSVLKIFSKPRPHWNSVATGVTKTPRIHSKEPGNKSIYVRI